jgi:glycosyltransferase involved in cell wall biosynthesis
LTALVEGPDHVCCRYRIAALRPYLERAGHSLMIRPRPRHWWSWLGLGKALRDTDVVILQRRLLSRWQLALLRRAARWLIFDVDDAVFLRDSHAPKGLFSTRRLRRFACVARAADAIVVGNSFLGAETARWAAAGRVHLIPTCVDPARYSLAAHGPRAAGVKLAWIGSSSTLRGLEAIRPVLEEIGRRVPGVGLRLICDRSLKLDHLPVEACPWTEVGEVRALAAGDIGISFLPDDLWSRGKCGLKVLQYMAAGLPVVANPVGVQADMVRHGENGFLVKTTTEWVQTVGRLSQDAELRCRMGSTGRRRVETDFSVCRGAARWLELIAGLGRSEVSRGVA